MDARTITPSDRLVADGRTWEIAGIKEVASERTRSLGAGALDRRVTVERASIVANELNEPIETWSAIGHLWAARNDVSDGERLAAGQVGSFVMARFTARSSGRAAYLEFTVKADLD